MRHFQFGWWVSRSSKWPWFFKFSDLVQLCHGLCHGKELQHVVMLLWKKGTVYALCDVIEIQKLQKLSCLYCPRFAFRFVFLLHTHAKACKHYMSISCSKLSVYEGCSISSWPNMENHWNVKFICLSWKLCLLWWTFMLIWKHIAKFFLKARGL